MQEAAPVLGVKPRVIAGRDEWFFRSLHALLAFLTPRRAPVLARTGVAAFSISLLLPLLASSMVVRPSTQVVVAAATDVQPSAVYELPPLSDRMARPAIPPRDPTPQPTAVAPAPIAVSALPANGSLVSASWYGPGFYENRLPCWQWLATQGLSIQFLPDTWGVAHKTLPCGTMVTLTHGINTVTVPVVDRGPYIAGREFDLSPRVKAALGCTDLCTVEVQIR